ncbi:EH signature domain-containing protein [Fulvimarina sp. MAC3]|uniref:EH signature domain-containing protein n=1 Tax=Fulvimarina sp. MAC3 TaxID=3148887 RepID=UPI0031FE1D1D
MTAFRDALGELIDRHPTRPMSERTSKTQSVAARMQLPEAGARKEARDYEAIAAECLMSLENGVGLTRTQLRDVAWCLWGLKAKIASSDSALREFLAQLERIGARSSTRALALAYLYKYHPDADGIEDVAATLKRVAEIAREPFPRLAREWAMFDGREGSRRLAQLAIDRRRAPSALMTDEKFSASISQGNFAKTATFDALQALSSMRVEDPEERLDFVKDLAINPEGQLYFSEFAAVVANALLLPFRDHQPDEAVCDRYLDVLIGLFRDPRTNSGQWAAMPEAAEIARGWLTRQALRQFLDVVDAVAPDEMWSYRRTFWEAVYDKKLISGAWVVLDPQGQAEARRRFGGKVRFGRFEKGGGIQTGHSVLLLKIGSETCAEWSHSGACRFWANASAHGVPSLYRSLYAAEELRGNRGADPVLEVRHYPHHGPGAWQHKVARRIFSATGTAMQASEYL